MREVWLLQVVSPGIKLAGLAGLFGATSAFVLPPSHVDHPNRLVLGLTSAMSESDLREELEGGNHAKYVVGFCKEEWGTDYPIGDPEFVPLQLRDPLLEWAMKRSPTGPNGFTRGQAGAWAAAHRGEYFFRHSSELPAWPPEGRAALRVRPPSEITASVSEFPWRARLALTPELEASIARADQAGARIPVSAPEAALRELIARY